MAEGGERGKEERGGDERWREVERETRRVGGGGRRETSEHAGEVAVGFDPVAQVLPALTQVACK